MGKIVEQGAARFNLRLGLRRKVMVAEKKAEEELVLGVDVDSVWLTFYEKSGWKDAPIDLEKNEINERIDGIKSNMEEIRARFEASLQVAQNELEAAEMELETIDSREEKAREYLNETAKRLAELKLASESVLLAALYEKFPSAKSRPKRKAKREAPEISDEIKQAVLDNLDSEGKKIDDLKKDLADLNISSAELKGAVKVLEIEEKISKVGTGRGAEYFLLDSDE